MDWRLLKDALVEEKFLERDQPWRIWLNKKKPTYIWLFDHHAVYGLVYTYKCNGNNFRQMS